MSAVGARNGGVTSARSSGVAVASADRRMISVSAVLAKRRVSRGSGKGWSRRWMVKA